MVSIFKTRYQVLKAFCILALLIPCLFTAGCIEKAPEPSGALLKGGGTAPSGLEQHIDSVHGYSLSLPRGWTYEFKEDRYIEARDGSGEMKVIIEPASLSGSYQKVTAVGLSGYVLATRYASTPYRLVSVKKSPDDTTLTADLVYGAVTGTRHAVVTTDIRDGAGLILIYEAPETSFSESEPLLRSVISGFKLTSRQSGSSQPALSKIIPSILPNPLYPQFPGAITLSVPPGWTAQQYQADTCTINWWAGNDGFSHQVFSINQIMVFKSAKQKSDFTGYYSTYGGDIGALYSNLLGNVPVSTSRTAQTLMTRIIPEIGENPVYENYYPSIMGTRDVVITGTWTVPPVLENALRGSGTETDIQGYFITFTKNGIPMTAKVLAFTHNTGLDTEPWWWGSIWGIAAPASEYPVMEPTLGSVLFSMQVNPGWMTSCRDVANYMSSVSSDVFRERQASVDRMSAKWSDAMLGFERLYNPDTGEAYQTGQWFPRTYEMNREKFEMQNLRELTPEEWAIIPVDGTLHIK